MSKVMKKNLLLLFNCVNYIELKHTIRIMKITTVLTLIVIFQLSATSLHSQNVKVSISRNNLPLKEFIQEIERQTDYLFMYSEKEIDLQEKVHVNAKNKPVSKILEEVFGNSEIAYNFNEGYISLRTRNNSVNQTKKIAGVVKDTNEEPVIGANVIVKGTTNGNVTDIDGRFSLEVPQNATLVVSYIGYLSQEINVGNKNYITVELSEDNKTLDEVIVVGYGTTSAKKIVSAVTPIKGEKLQDLPYATITGSLQGRAPGVIVQQQGGEPGSTPKISIRGGSDPVYVIDGVISEAWDFNMINPVDIENISILKDAASLAVYGSRAADGIILVKTKQGRKGKTSITYSFNALYSQPTTLPEKIDSYTYATLQNTVAKNEGYPDYHVYSKEAIEAIKNQTDPFRLANTDWIGLGLKSFAPEYRHSLSMNGNAKNINYYLSLGIMDQGSLYKSNSLNHKRYTLRSNVNTTFEEIGLTISLNVNGAVEKKNFPSFGGGVIWDHLFSRLPITPAFNEDGTFASGLDHPLVEMDKRSGYTRNDGKFINTQFIADWALPWVKGLTVGTMLNYRLNDSFDKVFKTTAPQYNSDGSLFEITKPTLKETAKFGDAYNFELNASYAKVFAKKHSLEAKTVFTFAENDNDEFWASRKDYLSTMVDQLFAGSPIGQLNSGSAKEGGRLGLVGRLKYDFNSRYYIEGSFRYDGSDNFAPGYRWGFFPSVAAAWDITEEPFFKALDLSSINLLKIRASYGKTGTESGVDRFGYLSVYEMNENAITIGGNLYPGFSEGKLVSPRMLSWYTRNSLNYGLDMAFLNHRLKGSADYFFYVTKGGLMSPADKYTTPLGKPLPQIKSDSEQRREGVELTLRWNDTAAKDFTYEIGFNMTYFNNLWVKKADESQTDLMNPNKRVTHQTDYYSTDNFKHGYIDNGFYQTPEQIINTPRRPQATELRLGDLVYQDINGDGKIDGEDQVRIGMPTMPHFTYGIDFNFSYKGLSLSGLLYGTGKRNMEFGVHYKNTQSANILDKAQLDFWREDNPNASFPRPSVGTNSNGSHNQANSTFWLSNAKFFRLKNLQLAYDFKYKLLKNIKWLNMCRLNITGTNLFTVSEVMDYFDPETTSTTGGYPTQRVYSLGLTVGF